MAADGSALLAELCRLSRLALDASLVVIRHRRNSAALAGFTQTSVLNAAAELGADGVNRTGQLLDLELDEAFVSASKPLMPIPASPRTSAGDFNQSSNAIGDSVDLKDSVESKPALPPKLPPKKRSAAKIQKNVALSSNNPFASASNNSNSSNNPFHTQSDVNNPFNDVDALAGFGMASNASAGETPNDEKTVENKESELKSSPLSASSKREEKIAKIPPATLDLDFLDSDTFSQASVSSALPVESNTPLSSSNATFESITEEVRLCVEKIDQLRVAQFDVLENLASKYI